MDSDNSSNLIDQEIYSVYNEYEGIDIHYGLELSCIKGHIDVFKHCISRGALVSGYERMLYSDWINSPDYVDLLSLAAYNGHFDIVKHLIKSGFDPKYNDYSALNCACERNYLEIVKYLVNYEAVRYLMSAGLKFRLNVTNIPITKISELLAVEQDFIATNSSIDSVKNLLYTSTKNYFSNVIDTSLVYAARGGSMDILMYLLELGASHNFAIICASIHGQLDVVKYLLQKGQEYTTKIEYCIIMAAQYGQVNVVKYLIESGNELDHNLDYCLKVTMYYGHTDTVKYLCNRYGERCYTSDCLIMAIEQGHSEIAKFLIVDGGIQLDNDNYIKTAVQRGHINVLKLLVSLGMDFTINKNLPIRIALRECHFQIVEYLIGKGVDIRSNNGYIIRWSLHGNSKNKVSRIIKYVTDNYADMLNVIKF
ncbi:putative ankyrin repeat protein [Acanthamoeba polyphaga mimivirus]|uniref:Putative ankyrin repeat protein n=1 Tax=Acanthamoeba polyphaga mimivirus TaxID=212035 RepID=A0A0G2Y733_MIMIV|nr:putative ankyrin repeat protein [Acanthamoeba polyphaga mimivirus]